MWGQTTPLCQQRAGPAQGVRKAHTYKISYTNSGREMPHKRDIKDQGEIPESHTHKVQEPPPYFDPSQLSLATSI